MYTAGKVKGGMVELTCDRATLLCRIIERERKTQNMDTKIKGDSNLKHFQPYGETLNNWMLAVFF